MIAVVVPCGLSLNVLGGGVVVCRCLEVTDAVVVMVVFVIAVVVVRKRPGSGVSWS